MRGELSVICGIYSTAAMLVELAPGRERAKDWQHVNCGRCQ